MNDTIAAAITEMERQRDQLTAAIDTLRALNTGAAVASTMRKSAGGGAFSARRRAEGRGAPADDRGP